jgi:hypothetical protein
MKRVLKSIQLKVCVICFRYRMVRNKEMLYCHCLFIFRICKNQGGLKVNGTHQLWICSYADANILCENINTTNKLNSIHEQIERRLNMEVLVPIQFRIFCGRFHWLSKNIKI